MRIQNITYITVCQLLLRPRILTKWTQTEILLFWRTGKGYETVGNKILVMKK